MKTYFDCIPCLVRQSVDSIRLVTDDEAIQDRIVRETLRATSEIDLNRPPVCMAQQIHRRVRELTRNKDPYAAIKKRLNQLAIELLDKLQARVQSAADPLEAAVRLAIAGNIMDFGIKGSIPEDHIEHTIHNALTEPLDGCVATFKKAVDEADDILYLMDNAGEIVFDRLLLGCLPKEKITCVVKGGAIINDATMSDAHDAGITQLVKVIDNGSDAPGTVLDDCSDSFRARFARADLIISKGQANYETLESVPQQIFFLLKVKCEVIAEHLGRPLGTAVLWQSRANGPC